jgi:hypothetical protein
MNETCCWSSASTWCSAGPRWTSCLCVWCAGRVSNDGIECLCEGVVEFAQQMLKQLRRVAEVKAVTVLFAPTGTISLVWPD